MRVHNTDYPENAHVKRPAYQFMTTRGKFVAGAIPGPIDSGLIEAKRVTTRIKRETPASASRIQERGGVVRLDSRKRTKTSKPLDNPFQRPYTVSTSDNSSYRK